MKYKIPKERPKERETSLEMMIRGEGDLVVRDRRAVELALPAHLLAVMLAQVAKDGVEMRIDLRHRVNLAAILPLKKLDELSVARVAQRIDSLAVTLLRLIKTDSPREALYQVAMFAIVLVDEGYFADVQNMAVLVAMLLLEDVKSEEPDVNGARPVWSAHEAKWRSAARDLLRAAQWLGYYAQTEQLIAPIH